MDFWEDLWNKIISDPKIKIEYKNSFLLNIFKKLCSRMNKDPYYKRHILVLYRQSFNKTDTIKVIVKNEFDIDLTPLDAKLINQWLEAFFKKNGKRKTPPQSVKDMLYKKQNGVCISCGQSLGNNWNDINVDHIIPWVLVGDELEDNYQLLCETCNKCKSSKTDYILMNLLNLN